MTSLRRIAATLTALFTLALAAGCSAQPGPDELYLYYNAGAGDSREFVNCVQPSTRSDIVWDNDVYALPTNDRTWNIAPKGGDSDTPIESGSKPANDGQPGPKVVIFAVAKFWLNADCTGGKDSPAVRFWEQLGRRYNVSDDNGNFNDAGFKTVLLNTIVPAETRAFQEVTRDYTADALDANLDNAYAKVESAMAPRFLAALRAQYGNDYFCGVGYSRDAKGKPRETTWKEPQLNGDGTVTEVEKKGTCPPVRVSITNIDFADKGIADARAAVFRAEQDAKAKLIAANAELEQSRILGQAASNDAYLRYKQIQAQAAAAEACRANANCTVIIDGGSGGTGVNVTPRR